jgi:hypothetical protein
MLDLGYSCDIIWHMGRKAKIPQEVLDFKQLVESKGLTVSLNKIPNCKTWDVGVLQQRKYNAHCIWNNDPEVKNLELNKFWDSKAWKEYSDEKAT